MKTQINEKWGTCHISNAKDQLKHSFSKLTINKRKVLLFKYAQKYLGDF